MLNHRLPNLSSLKSNEPNWALIVVISAKQLAKNQCSNPGYRIIDGIIEFLECFLEVLYGLMRHMVYNMWYIWSKLPILQPSLSSCLNNELIKHCSNIQSFQHSSRIILLPCIFHLISYSVKNFFFEIFQSDLTSLRGPRTRTDPKSNDLI